ncbi:MAG: hypothetical protein AAF670_03100 [Planctomycetota bacterium]
MQQLIWTPSTLRRTRLEVRHNDGRNLAGRVIGGQGGFTNFLPESLNAAKSKNGES